MNSYDPIDDDAAEIKRLEMENGELRAELAAERERNEKLRAQNHADGNEIGTLILKAKNAEAAVTKLREALVRVSEYDGGTSPWRNWVAAIKDIAQAAIDEVA